MSRLPYHLILEKDTYDNLDIIGRATNPKLRKNHLINRCIRLTKLVIKYSEKDNLFKAGLNSALNNDNFKKFFFQGGE